MFLLVKLNVRENRRINKEWTKTIHNIAQYSQSLLPLYFNTSLKSDSGQKQQIGGGKYNIAMLTLCLPFNTQLKMCMSKIEYGATYIQLCGFICVSTWN